MDATTAVLYFGSKQIVVYPNHLNAVRTQTKLCDNELIKQRNLWIKPHIHLIEIKSQLSATHFDDKIPTFVVASGIMIPAPIFA